MSETRSSIVRLVGGAFVMTASLAAAGQRTPSEKRSTAATLAEAQRWPPLLRDPTVPLVSTRPTGEATERVKPPLCGRRRYGFDHAAYQRLCGALQNDGALSGIRLGRGVSRGPSFYAE